MWTNVDKCGQMWTNVDSFTDKCGQMWTNVDSFTDKCGQIINSKKGSDYVNKQTNFQMFFIIEDVNKHLSISHICH